MRPAAVGDQGQQDGPEPRARRLRHAPAPPAEKGPDGPGDQWQHQQRMGRAAVPGHQRDRVLGEQRDRQAVQIGQRAQHRARHQRRAAVAGGHHGGRNGAAKHDLGEGIHGESSAPALPDIQVKKASSARHNCAGSYFFHSKNRSQFMATDGRWRGAKPQRHKPFAAERAQPGRAAATACCRSACRSSAASSPVAKRTTVPCARCTGQPWLRMLASS